MVHWNLMTLCFQDKGDSLHLPPHKPGADTQIPVADEGVISTGEELEGRLIHNIQHTCASAELCAKTRHQVTPVGEWGEDNPR